MEAMCTHDTRRHRRGQVEGRRVSVMQQGRGRGAGQQSQRTATAAAAELSGCGRSGASAHAVMDKCGVRRSSKGRGALHLTQLPR